MIKFLAGIAVVAAVAVSCFLLWRHEQAAMPAPLNRVHQSLAGDCRYCHEPWKGPAAERCLGCHAFGDVSRLSPLIRFHQAEILCPSCHREHKGVNGDISRMQHELLNPDLLCSQCHLDPHREKFGQNCRGCHGISTFEVDNWEHPEPTARDCAKCHRPPASHQDPVFWERIVSGHFTGSEPSRQVDGQDCYVCHVTHDWRVLLMKHEF
ncbi:MAG: hypothetical protein JRI97_12995 [Deltaproteobacteria bacterium]|nr:hypothetical protein [Deltaproteobacteria bacterium]